MIFSLSFSVQLNLPKLNTQMMQVSMSGTMEGTETYGGQYPDLTKILALEEIVNWAPEIQTCPFIEESCLQCSCPARD